jgi:hypothetical protein
MFRDESQNLSNKRQRLANTNSKKPRPAPRKAVKELSPEDDTKPTKSLVKPLSLGHLLTIELGISAEDQASCFFFQNYVSEEQQYHNGNFQYLADIYASEEVASALTDSVVSLGMVGLSNFWKAPSIMADAHTKYNSALRLVSTRLRDIEEAKSNQTLVSVMLLGLYETNTCTGPQSMKSWTKHVSGAAALLSLRGKQQLATTIGRQVFYHLRTQVVSRLILYFSPQY